VRICNKPTAVLEGEETMTTNECKTVRRQIDEADQLNTRAEEHLRNCVACRTFRSERLALQSLMSNLDAVEAPADFYFRLRARLARNEEGSRVAGTGLPGFSFLRTAMIGIVFVAMLAASGLTIRRWLNSAGKETARIPQEKMGGSGAETQLAASGSPTIKATVPNEIAGTNQVAVKGAKSFSLPRAVPVKLSSTRNNPSLARAVEASAIRESAVSPAVVLTREATGPAVLVPLDERALKISIDNGRGSSRTISLPTVSFGSQRLMARESFVTPVAPPKSVW
jgi:hypothetical protein